MVVVFVEGKSHIKCCIFVPLISLGTCSRLLKRIIHRDTLNTKSIDDSKFAYSLPNRWSKSVKFNFSSGQTLQAPFQFFSLLFLNLDVKELSHHIHP